VCSLYAVFFIDGNDSSDRHEAYLASRAAAGLLGNTIPYDIFYSNIHDTLKCITC
jgi:hypothetical protein